MARDITGQKKLEEQLRQSEAGQRLLLETMRAIPWEADAHTLQFTYVGPQAVKILGYPLDRWFEKDFWMSHLQPDDRDEAINSCLEGKGQGRDYESE